MIGGERRADSPVFPLDAQTGRAKRAAIGVWAWVKSLIDEAADRIEAAMPATQPGPVQRRGRLSDRELMLGGALLVGAATSLVYWLTV